MNNLIKFLEMPLWDTTPMFDAFKAIGNHTHRGTGLKQFLFIEGTRQDKVVLVAHADTVWDFGYTGQQSPKQNLIIRHEQKTLISSGNKDYGLGADDRAGCAMLWELRDSGHSLLVTSGEEMGRAGSRFLMEQNRDVAEKINSHAFLIQIDRRNDADFKCYNVGTSDFRSYVAACTGYTEPDMRSITDIVVLCKNVCGVNLSCGYYDEHTPYEYLVYEEWKNTLEMLKTWLKSPLTRFPLLTT